MLRLFTYLQPYISFSKSSVKPIRSTLYMGWLWVLPSIHFKLFRKHPSYALTELTFFLKKNLVRSVITWVFWKFYLNNRPRVNTYKPTYFFTFGLMLRELQLPSRQMTRPVFKLVMLLWVRILLQHTMVWCFNYFSPIVFYIQRALLLARTFRTLHFILPHHFTLAIKYKRARSIKKWVKKSFYPNIFF
jgi:hypothetical protein